MNNDGKERLQITMTLVIIAAGMGSRYGGLKQIDPITENGSFIIDFSIFDAVRAGFDKVVFVIKKQDFEVFKETIGKRVDDHIKVEYAFQELDDLPIGVKVPEGRIKPWGTAHAVLAARHVVKDNFAVINADDFYGKDAFAKLAEFMSGHSGEKNAQGKFEYCMIGYVLKNTLTENGTVSRGVCKVDENNMLKGLTELTKIRKDENGASYLDGDDWKYVSPDSLVSMNCWGFSESVFKYIGEGFERFLGDVPNCADPLKCEYYLPFAIDEMMKNGDCTVTVCPTTSSWHGVTYAQDKAYVKEAIADLIKNGEYPEKLWD